MLTLAARSSVVALYARLCKRIAAVHAQPVAELMRVFLEVSSERCVLSLCTLEFEFDEDDGRVARVEATFIDPGVPPPEDGYLPGYEMSMVLPRILPRQAPSDPATPLRLALDVGAPDGALVPRFLRALADLGAYRTIEPLVAVSASAYLL